VTETVTWEQCSKTWNKLGKHKAPMAITKSQSSSGTSGSSSIESGSSALQCSNRSKAGSSITSWTSSGTRWSLGARHQSFESFKQERRCSSQSVVPCARPGIRRSVSHQQVTATGRCGGDATCNGRIASSGLDPASFHLTLSFCCDLVFACRVSLECCRLDSVHTIE
jgi:hypothetical protein